MKMRSNINVILIRNQIIRLSFQLTLNAKSLLQILIYQPVSNHADMVKSA